MKLYLAKIQKIVDKIVSQSNCETANASLRLNHYIWLALISIPLGLPFIFKNLLTNNYSLAFTVALVMGGMLASLSFITKVNKPSTIYHANNFMFILMLISVSILGDKSEGQILWCYMYPMLSIFLFGARTGVWWSFILLVSVILGLGLSGKINVTDSLDFEIRFCVVYLTILSISSWSEYYRNRYTEESIRQKRELEKEREALNAEITRRIQLETKLQKLANYDGLTEMYNRRYFLTRASEEVLRAQRYNIPVSLALIDMDKFKRINDTYGHPAGDEVLTSFSKHCKQFLRESDVAGRIGGEEFAILLTHTPTDQAYKIMDRFRQEVSELLFTFNGEKCQVTISIGLSLMDDKNNEIDHLYSSADNALYKAKQKGRNKVEIDDDNGNK